MPIKLEDLLELDGNTLEGGKLIVKNMPLDDIVCKVKDDSITTIISDVEDMYLILDSNNKVRLVELRTPGAAIGFKNISADCIIAVTENATINMLHTPDGKNTPSPIRLGEVVEENN